MIYGYIRVSSVTQNIARQYEEMRKLGIPNQNIFIDKQSGKDFERAQYQEMISILAPKDLVIIKSIDRLGRNYEMIIEEWQYITKKISCDILVLDMPILDTRERADNLIGKFISDIVLQILSFVAENERLSIKERQREGINLAKAKGIHMGRPAIPVPNNFNEIAKKFVAKEICVSDAIKLLDLSKGTFYRNIKLYLKEQEVE